GTAPDFDLGTLVESEAVVEPKVAAKDEASKSEKSAESEKTAEGKKVASAEKAGAKANDKDAAKSEDEAKLAGGQAKQIAESEQRAYPSELKTGWELREAWWKGKRNGEFPGAAAPRVFRRLEAILLRAEQSWRGGVDSGSVEQELKKSVSQLQTLMDQ